MSLSSCIHRSYSGKLGALVALPFGAHMWYNKAIPGTNTGNHSHWAAMSLKTKVEVHPQSMSGDISLSSPSAPLLIRLTDQTAITRSRFISETTSQPPTSFSLHFSHLNTFPARQQSVLASMYHLRTVCHVNSVDWAAQQNCFLEGRSLPLPLLLLPPLTCGGLVREWWRLRWAATPARRAGIFDVPSHRRLVHTGGGCHLYTALSPC